MNFTITITDKSSLLGLMKARWAYNASLPTTLDSKGVVIPNAGILAADGDYLQMIVTNAVLSYAQQFGTDPVLLDSKISDLQAKKAELIQMDTK